MRSICFLLSRVPAANLALLYIGIAKFSEGTMGDPFSHRTRQGLGSHTLGILPTLGPMMRQSMVVLHAILSQRQAYSLMPWERCVGP